MPSSCVTIIRQSIFIKKGTSFHAFRTLHSPLVSVGIGKLRQIFRHFKHHEQRHNLDHHTNRIRDRNPHRNECGESCHD